MKKSLKLFMVIGAAVMLAFFFLPTVKLPELGEANMWKLAFGYSSVSGLRALSGMKVAGVTVIPGEFLALTKLVFPILIGLLWFLGKHDNRGKLSGIFSLLHAGVCVGFIWIVKSMMENAATLALIGGDASLKNSNLMPKPGILLFVEVGIALLMAVLSFLISSGKLSEDETNLKTVTAALGEAGKNAGATAAAMGQGVKQGVQQSMNNANAQSGKARTCQNCGASLPAGQNFCGRCGAKYVAPSYRSCQKCGAVLEDGDLFCPVCGSKQEEKKMRLCMHCGKTFGQENDFCPYCGKSYVDPEKRTCKNCGAPLPVGTDFCGRCGTRYV